MMIWRSNTAAECDYFNEVWLQFRGRSMEQECGNGWAEGVHAEDAQRCLETYLDAFQKREPFEMEYRLYRHDGVYRWIFHRGVPFFSENGQFQGYIGSCVDVTPRVDAEREIEEQWKAAFESNPTMYFIVDTAGTIVMVNALGAEQLGYSVGELLGRPVWNVFYEPDRDAVQKHA